MDESISGSLFALFLYDVSDEFRLDELRRVLKAPSAVREPAFRQPALEERRRRDRSARNL